jgi:hypothetical protein
MGSSLSVCVTGDAPMPLEDAAALDFALRAEFDFSFSRL